MSTTDSMIGLIAGLIVCAVGVAVMCAAAWFIGKSNAEADAADAGQQQPDADEWVKLSEEEKEYLRRFFK